MSIHLPPDLPNRRWVARKSQALLEPTQGTLLSHHAGSSRQSRRQPVPPLRASPRRCHRVPGSGGGAGTRDQLAHGEGRATNPLQSACRAATPSHPLGRREAVPVTQGPGWCHSPSSHSALGMGPRGARTSPPPVPGGVTAIVPSGLSQQGDTVPPPGSGADALRKQSPAPSPGENHTSTKRSPLGCTAPRK